MILDQSMLMMLQRITIVLVIIYTFLITDIRKNSKAAQPTKVTFKFPKNVPAGIYGYALVLPNKLVRVSSDGQNILI